MRTRSLVLLLTLGVSACALADRNFGVGLSGGVFYPTTSAVKNTLGAKWTSFGVGPTWVGYRSGLHSLWDVDMWGMSSNNNRAFIALPTYGYQYVFGDAKLKDQVKPFVAAHVGPSYTDFRIGSSSARQLGIGGALEAGVFYSDRLKISARYNMMSKVKDFDFSGLNLTFTWTVTKF